MSMFLRGPCFALRKEHIFGGCNPNCYVDLWAKTQGRHPHLTLACYPDQPARIDWKILPQGADATCSNYQTPSEPPSMLWADAVLRWDWMGQKSVSIKSPCLLLFSQKALDDRQAYHWPAGWSTTIGRRATVLSPVDCNMQAKSRHKHRL